MDDRNATLAWISSAITRSSSRKGTIDRYGFKKASKNGEVFLGSRKHNAWEAFISSMARTVSILLITRRHLVAPFAPILTWSSCPLEETIESTEEGVASCLFWLTILAAVYCGIINPLLRPGLLTKNAGSPRSPDT